MRLFLLASLCFAQAPLPEPPQACEDSKLGVSIWPHDAQTAGNITKDKLVAVLRQCDIGRVDGDEDLRDYRFVAMEKGRLYFVAKIPTGGTIGDQIAIVNWIMR